MSWNVILVDLLDIMILVIRYYLIQASW